MTPELVGVTEPAWAYAHARCVMRTRGARRRGVRRGLDAGRSGGELCDRAGLRVRAMRDEDFPELDAPGAGDRPDAGPELEELAGLTCARDAL